jgi:aquaporin TIP
MPNNWYKIALAELIGTFALCFIGILAISGGGAVGAAGAASLTSVALAHGLTIFVMVAAVGAISGGHFNPAVTFGFVLTGRMNLPTGLMYWASQLVGGALASYLLVLHFGGPAVAAATPNLAATLPVSTGFMLEVATTFFLVLVIFGSAVDPRAPKSVFPLAIGMAVALDIMAIGPLTGAAMNPARVFGPALASGQWSNHWLYWAAPLAGGAIAGLVYHFVLAEPLAPVAPAERGGPTPREERR